MPATVTEAFERQLPEQEVCECVEIYIPKALRHLSELYQFLRNRVSNRQVPLPIDGFSIYEVDGVFRGRRNKIWDERTLVIRILFLRGADTIDLLIRARINDLGRELADQVAISEEQIWICHYQQNVTRFRRMRTLGKKEKWK